MSRASGWSGPPYRRVGVNEVVDARVRSLSDFDFRVWAYLRQGPQSHRSGLSRLSQGAAAEDLNQPLRKVQAAIPRVCEALGWRFDAQERWLLIPEALAVTWDGSQAQMTGYLKELRRQNPPRRLLEMFEQHARETTTPTIGGTSPQTMAETSKATTAQTIPETSGGQVLVLDSYKYSDEKEVQTDSGFALDAASPSAQPTADDLKAAWNDITKTPIPRCVELTPERRNHATARLRDRGFEGMREVFRLIAANPFYRGENDRGWKPNFDWALKPANVLKVLEGAHVGKRARAAHTAAEPGKYDAVALEAVS